MGSLPRYITLALMLWVAALVPLGLFYYLAVKPGQARLQGMVAAVAQKEAEFQRLARAKAERTMSRCKGELEKLQGTFDAFVLPRDGVSGLDFRINEIAEENALEGFSSKITVVGANPALVKSTAIAEYTFRVYFEADFRRFLAFMNALERQSPVIFVDQFSINRDLEHPSRVLAELDLAVFHEKGA